MFRTHGCCSGADPDPNQGVFQPAQRSCGPNEVAKAGAKPTCLTQVWSYGNDTQAILSKYITLRFGLKQYIQQAPPGPERAVV